MSLVRDLRKPPKVIELHPKRIAQSIRYMIDGPQGLLFSIRTTEEILAAGEQNIQLADRIFKKEEAANE